MTKRTWCFLVRNPGTTQIAWRENVRYAVWQLEKPVAGDECDTLLRGYVEFKYSVRPTDVTNCVPTAVLYEKEGNREGNRARCMAVDRRIDGPWEYGKWEVVRGRPRTSSCGPASSTIPSNACVTEELVHAVQSLARNVEALSALQPITNTLFTVTNNNNNNGIIINGTPVVIRNVGDEDLSDFPKERLKILIEKMKAGLLEFIRETRFNPDKPQNRNIQIVSSSKERAVKKVNDEWHEDSVAGALDQLLWTSLTQFFRPLADRDYMDALFDSKPQVIDWHHAMFSKKMKDWNDVKRDAAKQLQQVTQAEIEAAILARFPQELLPYILARTGALQDTLIQSADGVAGVDMKFGSEGIAGEL